MPQAKRDILDINVFQMRVLKPFYVAMLCASLFFSFMVYAVFFFPDEYSKTTVILTECPPQNSFLPNLPPAVNFLNRTIQPHELLMIFSGIAVIVLIVWLFYWAYVITNRVLGPFERILTDLDKIVKGDSRKELTVRPGDEMFDELISRINVLIKRQKDRTNDRQEN